MAKHITTNMSKCKQAGIAKVTALIFHDCHYLGDKENLTVKELG